MIGDVLHRFCLSGVVVLPSARHDHAADMTETLSRQVWKGSRQLFRLRESAQGHVGGEPILR